MENFALSMKEFSRPHSYPINRNTKDSKRNVFKSKEELLSNQVERKSSLSNRFRVTTGELGDPEPLPQFL